MESKNLNESIGEEILSTSIDLGIDYAELVFDTHFTNEVLSEVPVFKSIYVGAKIFGSIRSFYTARNIMTFLRSFHHGRIDKDELKLFKEKFNNESKYREKVIDLIIQYNDRFLQSVKSKVFANLFISHINNHLEWDKLISLLHIVDAMNPRLINLLIEYYEDKQNNNTLSDRNVEGLLFGCGIGFRHGSKFRITALGQELYENGLKGIK